MCHVFSPKKSIPLMLYDLIEFIWAIPDGRNWIISCSDKFETVFKFLGVSVWLKWKKMTHPQFSLITLFRLKYAPLRLLTWPIKIACSNSSILHQSTSRKLFEMSESRLASNSPQCIFAGIFYKIIDTRFSLARFWSFFNALGFKVLLTSDVVYQ